MRTTLAKYGLGFGHLGVKVRGTTKYHLSPMEQKAFAGAFSVGVPNTLWRIRRLVQFNYDLRIRPPTPPYLQMEIRIRHILSGGSGSLEYGST